MIPAGGFHDFSVTFSPQLGAQTTDISFLTDAAGFESFQYALAGTGVAPTAIFVDTSATGADNGTSWGDAFVFLQDALAIAQPGDQIWVAEGAYYPDEGANQVADDPEVSFIY